VSDKKKRFVSTDPQSHKGQSDIWLTPLELIKRIGEYDYDPCPFPNHKTAKVLEQHDGLSSNWLGKVWLNPPYSEAEIWLNKLAEHGYGSALVFARTGSKWIQPIMQRADNIVFIKGRISFMRPDFTYGHNAGADSMILNFGCEVNDKSLGVIMKVLK
jgi:hypothetical protein